jgi:hypothetical protein
VGVRRRADEPVREGIAVLLGNAIVLRRNTLKTEA